MGDFLIDFRSPEKRQIPKAAAFLRFFDDLHVEVVDRPEFGLVLTSPDEPRLWGSAWSVDGNVFVGLCGRVSLEQTEWDEANRGNGVGGLACKLIVQRYLEGGIKKVCELSGHFVLLVFDRSVSRFHIVTDRWGIAPAFRCNQDPQLVFSSHPDVLADAAGVSTDWDVTSLAEFVLTAKLSYPFTFYRTLKSLPCASLTTVNLAGERPVVESSTRYFEYRFQPEPEPNVDRLAEELAAGFRKSVRKRTLPLLGRAALALSGGLDSRTLLCAAPEPRSVRSFCCYDEENQEFRTAQAIAHAVGAEFVPLQRSYDFYSDTALLGAKISGGMGCIASNHFLGFRSEFKAHGAENLLTGCYCDYVFKGLAFNKHVNRWTTRESAGAFDFSYYARHFSAPTPAGVAVGERLRELFPEPLRRYDSESCYSAVEQRRMFPLSYEEDNAARLIPQRVMGWYIPIAENDLLDVQLKLTSAMKLNRLVFAGVVKKVCGPAVTGINDANTGQPVNASWVREAISIHTRRVRRRLRQQRGSIATDGSWLNWSAYLNQSQKVRALWTLPNPQADDLFIQILGKDGYSKEIGDYAGKRRAIFMQLFTLKLWLDQRVR